MAIIKNRLPSYLDFQGKIYRNAHPTPMQTADYAILATRTLDKRITLRPHYAGAILMHSFIYTFRPAVHTNPS